MLAQFKSQFFRKGTDTNSKPDLTIDLKRKDKKEMEKWTASQKILAQAWIADIDAKFNAYKDEILNACK